MATPRKSILSASAAGAAVLVLIQMLSRLLTFIMNQLLVRYLTTSTLGVSQLLELYMMTILHFSRESLRMALQRQTDPGSSGESTTAEISIEKGPADASQTVDDTPKETSTEVMEGTSAGQSQSVINLSYLAVPAGVVVAAGLQFFYLSVAPKETTSQPYFWESVMIFTAATIVELLSEPGFALAQQRLLYTLRAGCESASVIASSIVAFALTLYGAKNATIAENGGLGTLPFAVGQLAGSIILLGGYAARLGPSTKGENFTLIPKKISKLETKVSYYFHIPTLYLAGTMWIQSIIKHVLSQGDAILVQMFASTNDQGNYALAANYGSLIARLLFRPLEETSRNLFANLLSTGDSSPSEQNLSQSITIFNLILKFYVLLSLLITTLGPPLAPLALRVVAGSRWADGPAAQTLSTYCYYIPLLAINGITEAFVQSVATPQQLRQQSVYMFSFSLAFAAAAYGFIKALEWGADGLVWANCVNMVLRITWSLEFIRVYYRGAGKGKIGMDWWKLMPSLLFVSVAVGAAGVARSTVGTGTRLEDYVKGAGLAGIVLAAGAFTEQAYFMTTYRLFASVRAKK